LGVTFGDGYLYLSDYYKGVEIFSLDDPAVPVFVTNGLVSRTRGLAMDANVIVISDAVFGLVAYKNDNPTHPTWTYIDSSEFANFEDVVLHKSHALIARNDEFTQIDVFDVSNPSNVFTVAEKYPTRFISSLSESGDTLLVAAGDEGVLAFDISNPTDLQFMWNIDTGGYARRAKIDGDFLFVADMSTLSVFNLKGLGGVQS
jgi:hypothetical protein